MVIISLYGNFEMLFHQQPKTLGQRQRRMSSYTVLNIIMYAKYR